MSKVQTKQMQEGQKDENKYLFIETKGTWQPLESMLNIVLEKDKTYSIKIEGSCELMISKDRPTFGISTNEITYKKDGINKLWIKTGERK